MPFVETHKDCPECGHKECLGVNEDGSAKCFSCGAYIRAYTEGSVESPRLVKDDTTIKEGEFYPLTDRGISLDTAKKYGVRSVKNAKGEITRHFYPYYNGSEEVAYKTRVVDTKGFLSNGPITECGLFGQQIVSDKGSKYITLVEGECDAMAAYELLGSKWPVVSIKSGAQGAERDVKSQPLMLTNQDKKLRRR